MDSRMELTADKRKYLDLLARRYPSRQAVYTEIINQEAILNLPKGTEHFISDIHGEYEAFFHILNNCSGVIREKVELVLGDKLTPGECSDLCTLIYYPEEKLRRIHAEGRDTSDWYRAVLQELIAVSKYLSAKYTRSKVRRALPPEFSYIIDELLHAQPDEDNNQLVYHEKILDTIIRIDNGDAFIRALAALIKRLAVDHLHIVGDIFDRGPHADKILDLLMEYHSLDIEWGNHDILWMGAAAGSGACIAGVLRNNLSYQAMELLESGYGISLRSLALFAEKTYPAPDPMSAAAKAISVILFKLEGQVIRRHPEYGMEDRLLLDKIHYASGTVELNGTPYPLRDLDFPTVDRADPYRLTEQEETVINELRAAFRNSERLNRHVRFLYEHGGMYCRYNGNLLFHGCIPLNEDGDFQGVVLDGKTYQGRAYMEYADRMARRAYFEEDAPGCLDFMWYLWCGKCSPLSGRTVKTFERAYIEDPAAWEEPKNPYFRCCNSARTCGMILREFGLYSPFSHIINGHTPVRVIQGESPVKADGKLIVIDGGFCRAYQKTTGIAGYTLIFNSHGMRIKSHRPFESVEKALEENKDMESESLMFETQRQRVMIRDTDVGKRIQEQIDDLHSLLLFYRQGQRPESGTPE